MSEQAQSRDKTNGRWSREEHDKFMMGLELYGKNWKKIQALVVTRNGSQIRSHAQKFFLKTVGKGAAFEDSGENHDPQAGELSSEESKKQKKCAPQLPKLNSPFFWMRISQLMGDPSFSLWKLIDQPAGDPSSSPKQPKSKSECSANQEQRALRNITSNVEAIANQASCFNIFNPISNL